MAGLLAPFRRDKKNDFASGDGDDLVKSQVVQVLMTEGDTPKSSGELPWRTDFGSAVHLVRHHRNDAVLGELVRVHGRDALKKWLLDVSISKLSIEQKDESMFLDVGYEGAGRGDVKTRIS